MSRMLIALVALFGLAACEKGPMERTGENLDEAAEEVQDETQDAADEIKDEIDDHTR